jgi:hypothetical protein
MNDERTIRLEGFDDATLSPIVRQAMQRGSAELLDWQVQSLSGGTGELGAGLVRIYRLTGHIRDEGEVTPWSLVLKSAQVSSDEATPDYLTREWHAYQSGFVGNLSGPVIAPKSFRTAKQSENVFQIWMEDLGDLGEQQWLLEDYELVARLFGEWNGSYLVANTKPDYPWFCQSTSKDWMEQTEPEIELLRRSLGHPAVRQRYPGDQPQTVLRLWDERSIYLNALEHLPQTICHNDAMRRNLLIKHSSDGRVQVVALDWEYLGWGAVGEEVAGMIGSLFFYEFTWARHMEFTEAVYNAYIEGLKQAGWNGDPRLVRLGFTAAFAMRYSFPYGLSQQFTEEGQAKMDDMLNQGPEAEKASAKVEADINHFIHRHAEEARSLIDELAL